MSKQENNFTDNLPGEKRMSAFKRRNNLTERLAANLKRSRENLDEATVCNYFDNLEKELVGE